MSYQTLLLKATEVKIGDRIRDHWGCHQVVTIKEKEGLVYMLYRNHTYHDYYKVSDTLEVLRWEEKEEAK